MSTWVLVTIDVEGALSTERTYVNMDNVTYVQQIPDGATLVHFDSGQTLTVKESVDVLVGRGADSS